MVNLRCTVRRCGALLESDGSSLKCIHGHCFDRAKEGYWNLTQPQDKKSANPGDSDAAVLARKRWLDRGHGSWLVENLRGLVADHVGASQILDLGCGEGSFGKALFSDCPDCFCGIDLSRKAIRLASRNWPEATWVLANADRGLPVADQSCQLVMSLFGRRPVTEVGRVLANGGQCIIAVPGEEDLIELREKVQQTGQRRSRWGTIVDEMQSAGLSMVKQLTWTHKVALGTEDIADALAMTYRAVRNSEQSKVQSLDCMNVTLAADILHFRRS